MAPYSFPSSLFRMEKKITTTTADGFSTVNPCYVSLIMTPSKLKRMVAPELALAHLPFARSSFVKTNYHM